MCGRYSLSIEDLTKLTEVFSTPMPVEAHSWKPRYNVAPTQELPIVLPDKLTFCRWGWSPPWLRTQGKSRLLINARAETIDQKPSFRRAFLSARCLVPADSFYEWQMTPGGRRPFRIRMKREAFFFMAGLFSSEGFLILTSQANAGLASIHARMPLILDLKGAQDWLSPSSSPEALKKLFVPLPDARVEAIAVSSAVNSVQHDGPECHDPLLL